MQVAADVTEASDICRKVIQAEITLTDEQDVPVPDQDQEVTVSIDGPLQLLGMDNGRNDLHEPFQSNTMRTWCGRLYLILRCTGEKGNAVVTLHAGNLPEKKIFFRC